MAKFTRLWTGMSIEHLLDFDKITARQPTQKLIRADNHPGFRNSTYNAFKKQRKTGAWIIGGATRGTKIVAHNSNKSIVVTNDTTNKAHHASSRVISFLIHYLPFLVIGGLRFSSYVVVVLVVVVVTKLFSKLFQIPKYREWVKNLFKDMPEEIIKEPQKTTSAAPYPKWTLTGEDLFWTLDAYTFEKFVFSMCVLLGWWVLSRLNLFVRRYYSLDVKK